MCRWDDCLVWPLSLISWYKYMYVPSTAYVVYIGSQTTFQSPINMAVCVKIKWILVWDKLKMYRYQVKINKLLNSVIFINKNWYCCFSCMHFLNKGLVWLMKFALVIDRTVRPPYNKGLVWLMKFALVIGRISRLCMISVLNIDFGALNHASMLYDGRFLAVAHKACSPPYHRFVLELRFTKRQKYRYNVTYACILHRYVHTRDFRFRPGFF